MWCIIRADQLRIPLAVCGPSPLRTLAGIKADHERFVAAGADQQQHQQHTWEGATAQAGDV